MAVVRFTEFVSYSPTHDAEMARVSIANEHGQEFFAIVHYEPRGYRERRDKAIDKCLEAIKAGCDPGEVRWR